MTKINMWRTGGDVLGSFSRTQRHSLFIVALWQRRAWQWRWTAVWRLQKDTNTNCIVLIGGSEDEMEVWHFHFFVRLLQHVSIFIAVFHLYFINLYTSKVARFEKNFLNYIYYRLTMNQRSRFHQHKCAIICSTFDASALYAWCIMLWDVL